MGADREFLMHEDTEDTQIFNVEAKSGQVRQVGSWQRNNDTRLVEITWGASITTEETPVLGSVELQWVMVE